MRLLFLFLITVSCSSFAQINDNLIYGKWKIKIIDNGIFKMDMGNAGEVVHRMLEEEREEGETMTEADSLKMLGDVNKVYSQFKNLQLHFKKNGKVIYNLGSKTGKDAATATNSKGTYSWQADNLIVIKSETGDTEALKVVTLTKDELELKLVNQKDRNVVFLFKK